MTVLIEDLRTVINNNGVLFEPLNDHELTGQGNVHVTLTEPGRVRGNHFHIAGREMITVFGATLVRYREGETTHEVVVADNEIKRFTFPAGVAHAFKNIGTKTSTQIAFNTEVHDPAKPDTVKMVLIES